MTEKIIVYRSRQEEAFDDFWFETIVPFIAAYWWLLLPAIFVLFGAYAALEIYRSDPRVKWRQYARKYRNKK